MHLNQFPVCLLEVKHLLLDLQLLNVQLRVYEGAASFAEISIGLVEAIAVG